MNKLMLAAVLVGSMSFAYAGCNTATIASTTPTDNFTVDSVREVVIDHTTGLMWQLCVEGSSGADCRGGDATQTTYSGALESIEALNAGEGFAGYHDWRLPNVKELRSIVEERCNSPALNEEVFPLKNTESSDDRSTENNMVLFTSTPTSYYDADDVFVWVVDFDDGKLDKSSVGEYNFVRFYRLVRNAH